MSTKSLQIFDDKIRILKQHLQLSDLALTMANKACVKSKGNGKKYMKRWSQSQEHIPNLIIPMKK